jgi:hypothetical protein
MCFNASTSPLPCELVRLRRKRLPIARLIGFKSAVAEVRLEMLLARFRSLDRSICVRSSASLRRSWTALEKPQLPSFFHHVWTSLFLHMFRLSTQLCDTSGSMYRESQRACLPDAVGSFGFPPLESRQNSECSKNVLWYEESSVTAQSIENTCFTIVAA